MPTVNPEAECEVQIRHWKPASNPPRGVLVILHGLHSHSGRYCRFATALVKAGFAVYAPDHILHGRSTPSGLPLCDITDFDYFVADARVLITRVKEAHPKIPLFAFGHSMGSLILMHTLHGNAEMHRNVSAAIYSGFALLPGPSAAAPMGQKCLFCLTKGCCGICLGKCLAGCGPMAGALKFQCCAQGGVQVC